MPAFMDLTGQRFGRLVVVSYGEAVRTSTGNRRTVWNVVCDCGTELAVRAGQLRHGRTRSCGCLKRELCQTMGSKNLREVVTYATAHKRMYKLQGRATEHACVDCRSRAQDWSYVGSCADELLSGDRVPYCLHPQHYVPRCKSCHIAHDRKRDAAGRLVGAGQDGGR